MKTFIVPAGTQARLVKLVDGSEMPFKTRKEFLFTQADVVIDPETVYHQTRKPISEYAFSNGDGEQRQKYLLVVPSKHVQMQEQEQV